MGVTICKKHENLGKCHRAYDNFCKNECEHRTREDQEPKSRHETVPKRHLTNI